MKTRSLLLVAVSLCALAPSAGAADWPQWRGPDRNDIAKETGLLKSWPKDGPPLVWTIEDAGTGYSGPAVVGDRLFTMGARGDSEYVIALDAATGTEKWSTKTGPFFKNGYGGGPRSTPTVDGDSLYALGASGDLVCLETATGRLHWHKNLRAGLDGEMMSGWGYSESPLMDGDRVVCSPGGSEGTLAALDKKTGAVIWRSKDLKDRAAYSSIVVSVAGGIRQYVQMTNNGVAGVAAEDGRLLWHSPLGANGTAVIPTPIVNQNYVFVTSGYKSGCGLVKLSPDGSGGIKADEVYANKLMENRHGGVVLLGDHLYGWTDNARGRWICQDFKTGKVVWESTKLGRGSVTYADGHLYCYSEDNGTVVLVEASPSDWKESSRFTIPKQTTIRSPRGGVWTHPVVANGRLYLRDQDLLFCYDIKERAR